MLAIRNRASLRRTSPLRTQPSILVWDLATALENPVLGGVFLLVDMQKAPFREPPAIRVRMP